MKKDKGLIYSGKELAAFCLQISILLQAAVPIEEGLAVMSEDASSDQEKKMLLSMSEAASLGMPFSEVLEETKAFPSYVIHIARIGQETGTLDHLMQSLAAYYEKESQVMQNLKNALTYPIMMLLMLLAVLTVLFMKVMPVFESVYEQLGAQLSPISQTAIHLGGVFSLAALVIIMLFAVAAGVIYLLSRSGKNIRVVDQMLDSMKRSSKIALSMSRSRFAEALSLTLSSGLELEKGLSLAQEIVGNSKVKEQIEQCSVMLQEGSGYYDGLKDSGLFTGFHLQLIKVGIRSGHMDTVMKDIADDYTQQTDMLLDNMISKIEPTVVAVLAVSVGLVLLSVMLPLVGVLSAIG